MTPQDYKTLRNNIKFHLEALLLISKDVETESKNYDTLDRKMTINSLNLIRKEVNTSISSLVNEINN